MQGRLFFDHSFMEDRQGDVVERRNASSGIVQHPASSFLGAKKSAAESAATYKLALRRAWRRAGYSGQKKAQSKGGLADVSNGATARNLAGRRIYIERAALAARRIYVNADDDASKVAVASYKSLRTRVIQQLEALNQNTLMIVGPTQNVGKTLTSINLALALARHQAKRVILVDLDLRSPSLSREFGFDVHAGIVDVANGNKSLEETLVDPGIENLTILPGTKRVEDSSELLLSLGMQALFARLNAQADTLVVYDTPPILGCDDVAAIAPMMGSCLMVIRQNETSNSELHRALRAIEGIIDVLGVTINGSSEAKFDAYYY